MNRDPETISALLQKYPLIIISEESYHYKLVGSMFIQGELYQVHMILPYFPAIAYVELTVTKNCQKKVFSLVDCPPQTVAQWTIFQLIEYIPDLFNGCGVISPGCGHRNDKLLQSNRINSSQHGVADQLTLLQTMVDDFETCHLENDGNRVRFSRFPQNPGHYLEVELPSLFVLQHSLPDGEVPFKDLLEKHISLGGMVTKFLELLWNLKMFYASLLAIDEATHVVAPKPIKSQHNWRMFALCERVFLKLVIDNCFVTYEPGSLQLIGPTYEMKRFQRAYEKRCANWSDDLDIVANLLAIFGMDNFPTPLEQKECPLCFQHLSPANEIPIVSCDKPDCPDMFHVECLRRWFEKLRSNEECHEFCYGKCPFCRTAFSKSFKKEMYA